MGKYFWREVVVTFSWIMKLGAENREWYACSKSNDASELWAGIWPE